ncbi:ParA family protein [Nodosilinea sp. E11]|uniref:ParA family protein n=1 Tax=Nodosilinea sp. E11 TaxID=3037479 RepID=UPI00293453F0|nr:AAA family ATPase [Nodosilinea sp. E11]WOD40630.1 AAA family ATPase [Nodosilinea sp. E11]
MTKIISLFNHKGGVSKTTTAFNLGWALADLGYKTLIVDADPQCNLTGLVLDYNAVEDFEVFYSEHPGCDLYTAVQPVLDGQQRPLEAASPIPTQNPNLHLLAGNIKLSESETQISVSLGTGKTIPALRNIPGSFGFLLRETARKHGFHYVLIDMSPSIGALNECLLMASDYFIVPTFPDFFCQQAIKSLSAVLPRWNSTIKEFRDSSLLYPIPASPPVFIGFISQKYRPRSGAPASSFQRWIDRIKETVDSQLVPALSKENMVIQKQEFQEHVSADTPYNLANIADFNSLMAQSQKHNVPIFALSKEQIEQQGIILESMIESRDNFLKIISDFAKSVIALTPERI